MNLEKKSKEKLKDKLPSCLQLRTIYFQLNKNRSKELQSFEEKH